MNFFYVLANRIANRINPSRQEAANKELFTALETGDVQKATEWIKKGADVNDLSSPPVRRTDPLRMVARSGYRTLVSLLLANGAMIKGGTPLHEAAAKGDEKAVMLFCANRASINAKDEENWQPLNWAMACGHKGIAEILIANGAEVDGNLEFAMGLGHVDDVEMLLSHSANVNSADCRGETPLHKAANMKSIRFAELLIARGADVNAVDAFGRTPLSEAVYGGSRISWSY
jgi:ankyrin repeat protein